MELQAGGLLQQNVGADDRDKSPVYAVHGLSAELCQAEIISNVAQYTYDPVTGRAKEMYHEYAIVLSQDCDLAQALPDPSTLNEILIYEISDAEKSREAGSISSKEWDRITKNLNDRYHFLEEIPKQLDLLQSGMPSLIIDFKRFFGMQAHELYRQCDLGHGARRRCRLESPYREHLQTRTAFYLQRVMLPVAHRKRL